MSTFVAIGYDDPHQAQEVRLALVKLQREYLIDMEDAVVAVKNEAGKIKLHQAVNLTAAGAVSGGFWGSLIGLLFLNPLTGRRRRCFGGSRFGGVGRRRYRRQIHEEAGRWPSAEYVASCSS